MNKFLKQLSKRRFLFVICISLLIHFSIGLFYGGLVIFEKFSPPEPELVAPPIPQGIEPRKKEYKIKMEKSQKQSSAPLPVPIVANIPSNLSLENIDMNVSTPRSDQKVRGAGSGDGVGKGFGDGFGNGAGFDLDINIEFFGAKGGGEHVAFVVDYSASMIGKKDDIMRAEMKRVVSTLPDGMMFGMVFFAGPAWPAEDGPSEGLKNWVASNNLDVGTFRPKNWSRLPKVKYKKSSSSSRSRARRYIEDTPLVLGTVFDAPIYMALKMDPTPDTIFFMTDGSCSATRGIDQIEKMVQQMKNAGLKVPKINVVGFGVSQNYQLKRIAELTGGEANYLGIADYEQEYGKVDKAKPKNEKPNIKLVQNVPPGKYPPTFAF